MKTKPIQVGSMLVQRVPSSTADYRAIHAQWHGYLCPVTASKQSISKLGKLIEVTSLQQLNREREAYRAEIDPGAEVQLAYYEVIDAGGA